MRSRPLLVALALLLFAAGTALSQEPTLTLRLGSGREFRGAIDNQSTDDVLVLRNSTGSATVRRPIRWGAIVSAALGDRAVTTDELRALAKDAPDFVPPAPRPPISVGPQQEPVASGQETPAEEPFIPVTTITFDPRFVNWDSDVETDGLAIDLFPLDGEGYLTPVSGSVEVEFFAPQRRVFHHAPLSGGDTLERVERWTVQIN